MVDLVEIKVRTSVLNCETGDFDYENHAVRADRIKAISPRTVCTAGRVSIDTESALLDVDCYEYAFIDKPYEEALDIIRDALRYGGQQE